MTDDARPRTSLSRTLLERLWLWRASGAGRAADLTAMRALFLDHVGVAAWGAQVAAGQIMREHAVGDLRQSGPALPLIGANAATSAVAAAMANAVAAHSFEFDDTHTQGSVHPGAVVFPAALAATALAGCDEDTFADAVIIGYEVMCRVARAVSPQEHRARRHYHPTATTGHFAAAAVAAVCFGLDVDRANAALGISGTAAGGSMEFHTEGSWVKQLHPAIAVQRGIQAAQLAARGFPGVGDPIAGPRAFLAAQTPDPRPEELLAGLGERPHEITLSGIKPYPSCRNTQAPADLLIDLRHRYALAPDDIEGVEFGLTSPGIRTVWDPPSKTRRPANMVQAQFSMPYVASMALIDGRVEPDQFATLRTGDPAVLDLMDKVVCVHDPELDKRYPESWPAWVRVTSRTHGELRAEADNPRGDPAMPLSAGQLRVKFDGLTGRVYDDERRDQIAAAIDALPASGALARLAALL